MNSITTNSTNYEYYTKNKAVYSNSTWWPVFAPYTVKKPSHYKFGIYDYGESFFLAIMYAQSSWTIFKKCKYCRKKPEVFVSETGQDFALCEHHANVYLLERRMKGREVLDYRSSFPKEYETLLGNLYSTD